MGTFVAIDFETAGHSRASACALGIAVFEAGRLAAHTKILINPGIDESQWSPYAMAVHGISAAAVRREPTFDAVAGPLLAGHAEQGRLFVAHNAAFDLAVLRAEFARYGLTCPPISYLCSMKVARAAWPQSPSVALDALAEILGIPLRHHDPGSDAVAAGGVLLRAWSAIGGDTIDECLERSGLRTGEA